MQVTLVVKLAFLAELFPQYVGNEANMPELFLISLELTCHDGTSSALFSSLLQSRSADLNLSSGWCTPRLKNLNHSAIIILDKWHPTMIAQNNRLCLYQTEGKYCYIVCSALIA